MLDGFVQGWDDSFPNWRNDQGAVAAIENLRGNEELAVSLTIENLERDSYYNFRNGGAELFYRHINFNKTLTRAPDVEKKLADYLLEVKQVGRDVSEYLDAHNLRL